MAGEEQQKRTSIGGDWVGGDKIAGDKIDIDQISDEAIAVIGRNARAKIIKQYGDTYILPGQEPQLFAGVPDFPRYGLVGRDQLLKDLIGRLQGGGTSLAAAGIGGAGKTALAVAAAYHKEILAHFKDGLLWASVGPGGDALLELGRWAEALGLDPAQFPDPGDLKQKVKDRIGSRSLLLVLDDIWQAEHAQLLRCGGPACAHLLTTRDNSIAADFAGGHDHVLHLPDLDPDPALQLLQTIAPDVVSAAGEEAVDLLRQVGGLPLAVELLGGYLVAGGSPQAALFADLGLERLEDLADPALRLQQAKGKLEDMSGEKISLGSLLALSLEGFEADEKAAYHALGAFAPKPATFGRPAAEAVSGAKGAFLLRLVNRNLLQIEGSALAMHQSLHDLASAQMDAQAQARHAAYYLDLIEEDRADWQRIDAAYAQIRWAWERLEDEQCLDWIFAIRDHQVRRGYWAETLDWQQRALAVARTAGLQEELPWLLNALGLTFDDLGQREQALAAYEEALPLMRENEDRLGESSTLNNMAAVYDALGRSDQALPLYEESLAISYELDDLQGQAMTLNNIGESYRSTGRLQQALDYFSEASQISAQIGDLSLQARTFNNMALVYQEAGQPGQALDLFQQALPLLQEVGERSMEARVLNNVGEVYRTTGRPEEALNFYGQALTLSREVGDRDGQAAALNNIGEALRATGKLQQALTYLEQALAIMREVGRRSGEARTLINIAAVYQAAGQPDQALQFYEAALPIMDEVGDRVGAATTMNNIGLIYQTTGRPGQALPYYEQVLPIWREMGHRVGQGMTLNNMALVVQAQGQPGQALDMLQEALPIMREVQNKAGEAMTLLNLAYLLGQEERNEEALAAIKAGIQIFQAGLTRDAAGMGVEVYENMLKQLQEKQA